MIFSLTFALKTNIFVKFSSQLNQKLLILQKEPINTHTFFTSSKERLLDHWLSWVAYGILLMVEPQFMKRWWILKKGYRMVKQVINANNKVNNFNLNPTTILLSVLSAICIIFMITIYFLIFDVIIVPLQNVQFAKSKP